MRLYKLIYVPANANNETSTNVIIRIQSMRKPTGFHQGR